MLTIFTVPKAFNGHIGVIQRNAIRSWLALRPHCEIVLFSEDPRTAECARELGVRHVAGVKCNEYGTPRLDDVFRQAAGLARFPLLCYVNTDIILPAAFTACVQRVRFSRFLMVGQRIDVDVDEELNFSDEQCRVFLEARVRDSGRMNAPVAMDYFVFPKGSLGDLPPFVVGRPGWDNWMILRGTQLRIPVVDATSCSPVIHQSHDYAHVPKGTGGYEGPEADYNRRFLSEREYHFAILHASWRLTPAGLARRPWWKHEYRDATLILSTAHPRMRPLVPAVGFLIRARDAARRRLSRG